MNKIEPRSSIFAGFGRNTQRTARAASPEKSLDDQVVRGLTEAELCAVGGGQGMPKPPIP
jgi:hypothetical protein